MEQYELAADQGHAVVQLTLGKCYYHGDGVDQDKQQAVKYYKLAADQGQVIPTLKTI